MKKHTVDMTRGSILRHIIAFAIPIMFAGILQTLYNAADMIVVGKFSGKEALAAVGSTSSAVSLLVNIFMGLSSATNVIVARKFGAGNRSGVSKAVHTAVALCICGGILLALTGVLFSKKILMMMDSPSDVLELSTLYMQIYFLGSPAMLLYNFGAAIMRAVGDAKRPTYFLTASGIINVLLNLLFVIVFKMSVAGVAIATVISQIVAAGLVLYCLIKTDGDHRLEIKKIKVYAAEMRETLALGIPAGIQSSMFALSNVIIQSSINAVGSDAVAGNSAAASIEGIVYVAMNSFFHAALTFTGQNYGAHDFKRMRKGFAVSMAVAFVVGIVISGFFTIFSEFFISFYTDVPIVRDIGMLRMSIICATYVLCGLMEVAAGSLRGMGVAVRSMITCVLGACVVRIVAVMIGAPYKTVSDLKILYYSYPVSWIITTTVLSMWFFGILRNREKEWIKVNDKAVSV